MLCGVALWLREHRACEQSAGGPASNLLAVRFLSIDTALSCAQGITAGKGAVSSLFERADFFKMYGNYMQVLPCPDTSSR